MAKSVLLARRRVQHCVDELDATGKKSLERTLAWDNVQWSEKQRQSFTCDSDGLLRRVTHADGKHVEYSYDSSHRLSGVEDEKHTADPTDPPPNTRYTYGPGGRLERVTQKLSTATPPEVVTSYSYDARGNLTEVTDPNGNITSSLYNDFDELVQTASAVTGTTAYEYDSAGLLFRTTDANGAATTRTYDDLNRILSATSSRTGVATEVVTWTYDESAAGRFGLGRLTSMSDPAGSTSYFYPKIFEIYPHPKAGLGRGCGLGLGWHVRA